MNVISDIANRVNSSHWNLETRRVVIVKPFAGIIQVAHRKCEVALNSKVDCDVVTAENFCERIVEGKVKVS